MTIESFAKVACFFRERLRQKGSAKGGRKIRERWPFLQWMAELIRKNIDQSSFFKKGASLTRQWRSFLKKTGGITWNNGKRSYKAEGFELNMAKASHFCQSINFSRKRGCLRHWHSGYGGWLVLEVKAQNLAHFGSMLFLGSYKSCHKGSPARRCELEVFSSGILGERIDIGGNLTHGHSSGNTSNRVVGTGGGIEKQHALKLHKRT